jgi:hypothetical protein
LLHEEASEGSLAGIASRVCCMVSSGFQSQDPMIQTLADLQAGRSWVWDAFPESRRVESLAARVLLRRRYDIVQRVCHRRSSSEIQVLRSGHR